MTNTDNLPRDLIDNGLFCCFRIEERGGNKTKVPYNAHTGGKAQSNNPATFAPFGVALAAQGRYDGLGVGIFNGISAIDIDHCVNEDGTLMLIAQDVVERFRKAGAYIEYSPSGKGTRILFRAPGFQYDAGKHYINRQKIGLEVYVFGATKKYVTVTGNAIYKTDTLPDCTTQLQAILDKYMRRDQRQAPPAQRPAMPPSSAAISDQDIICKAKAAKNGDRFAALWDGAYSSYNSQSEADKALCNMLAFWTNDNAAQMDQLFRMSGLMRDKWDRPQCGSTYGAITIKAAINTPHSVYNRDDYVKRKAASITTGKGDAAKKLVDLHPERNGRYQWSDIGDGNLFADWYKDVARYVPERKKWYVYDGRRWVADTDNLRVMELCKRLADSLVVYTLGIGDEKTRKDYLEYVNRWQKRSNRDTILKDAASVYPIHYAEFDADLFTFNCLNGTLNLISNNQVENAIRPFVVGRKGWLFSDTPKGAQASAILYSVMETAKANGLNLERYIHHLLAVLPDRFAAGEILFDDLLPWSPWYPRIISLRYAGLLSAYTRTVVNQRFFLLFTIYGKR